MDPDADFKAHSVHAHSKNPGASSHTPSSSSLILCISPSQYSGQFGLIYLSSGERNNEEALHAYFDGAGREVTTLPCPDFEGFLLANSLRTCNVSFMSDMSEYILRLGCRNLEDKEYSSDGIPDLSWLPRSPSETSPSLLSRGPTRSASRPPNVTTQAPPSRPPSRSDPDGLNTPLFFSMGGSDKSGVFSPLTSSDFYPIRGVSPPRDYTLTQRSSSETIYLPSSSVSIRSMAPTSVDTFKTVPSLVRTPSLVHTPLKSSDSILTIKDKPSDTGIKLRRKLLMRVFAGLPTGPGNQSN